MPSDLTETVEHRRKAKHPDLPADLVEQILQIETDHLDDQGEAYKRIQRAIEEFLVREGTEC